MRPWGCVIRVLRRHRRSALIVTYVGLAACLVLRLDRRPAPSADHAHRLAMDDKNSNDGDSPKIDDNSNNLDSRQSESKGHEAEMVDDSKRVKRRLGLILKNERDKRHGLRSGSNVKKDEDKRIANVRDSKNIGKMGLKNERKVPIFNQDGGRNIQKPERNNETLNSGKRDLEIKGDDANNFKEPAPIQEPPFNNFTDIHRGNFYKIGNGAFIYSAFLDQRKQTTFVRLIALFSKNISKSGFIFCHFESMGTIKISMLNERYEMCENHNKRYGGYVYSCPVDDEIDLSNTYKITISFKIDGLKTTIPLIHTLPLPQRLKYLNLQKDDNENEKIKDKKDDGGLRNSDDFLNKSLKFAVCVPPLFGDVSVFRFVEWMELTRLLGVNRVFIYDFSISGRLKKVIEHYERIGVVLVVPWRLPKDAESPRDLHYRGQLLAHNDCLYRTMRTFDFVAFNDIDEYIIPHNSATTWRDAIPQWISRDTAALSFKSAFFSPGSGSFKSLWTPLAKQRTEMFSRVRTKVMLVPWRVFEVGIHHVSKQNQEVWEPRPVPTDVAFLHHYRTCQTSFRQNCKRLVTDNRIRDTYAAALKERHNTVLHEIFPEMHMG